MRLLPVSLSPDPSLPMPSSARVALAVSIEVPNAGQIRPIFLEDVDLRVFANPGGCLAEVGSLGRNTTHPNGGGGVFAEWPDMPGRPRWYNFLCSRTPHKQRHVAFPLQR